MTVHADPFRTLGIVPGASLNEIKSAYRRLAKQYHPDAAGDRALPRFLAIQTAYETLVDEQGRLRRRSVAPAPPWAADPGRSRATREAYRARRAGGRADTDPATPRARGAGGGSETGGGPGTGGSRPRTDRARPSVGSNDARERTRSGDAGGRGGSNDTRERTRSRDAGEPRRRGRRTATPGSTTYDEAREVPFDPEWEGAGWYGPSLGTYWTINPREYADPRKHGPEYQARARRAVSRAVPGADGSGPMAARDPDAAGGPDGSGGPDAGGDPAAWRWSSRDAKEAAGRTDPGSADWRATGWRYRSARGAAGADAAPDAGRGRVAPDADPAPVARDLEAALALAAPARLRERAAATASGRLLVAIVGWPPLGLLVATLIDALFRCGGLAATCDPIGTWLPTVAQPAIVLVLAALPALAALAAFASLASLAVVVPAVVVLSASGAEGGDHVARLLVAGAAVGAYIVAWAFGAVSLRRAGDGNRPGGRIPA